MKYWDTTPLRKLVMLGSVCLMIAACSQDPNANDIINKAIKKAGGQKFEHSRISFTFRGRRYHVKRQGGDYEFTRTFTDSTGAKTIDRMENSSFTRKKDGRQVALSQEDEKAYSNALNSVIYFGLLPYKLNDAAVHKKLIGKSSIEGKPYFMIRATFAKKGGGKDFRDSFLYWINRNTYTMDYMAYRFHVNGGGSRLRQARNIRRIKGIRFADYNNYKGLAKSDSLQKYEKLYKQGKLKKVSEINLENIDVEILNGRQRKQ